VELDEQIEARVARYGVQMKLLTSIPGTDRVGAAAILAEIGPDMSRFATAANLAAWAGACPANIESAGRKKPAGARSANRHLLTVLCNAAVSASQKNGSYLRAKYCSLKSPIGGGKAMLAIGHKLPICIWHTLTNGEVYRDLGEAHLDRRNQQQALKRYARKLDALGYIIVPKQEATAVAA
jgi:transposase